MHDDRCDQARELLPWLVNGSLGGRERFNVWTHLSGCGACRQELREWVRWHDLVQVAALPDPARVRAVWHSVERNVEVRTPEAGLAFNPAGLPFDVVRDVIAWLVRRTAAI